MKLLLTIIFAGFAASAMLTAADECKEELKTHCVGVTKRVARCIAWAEGKFSEPCLLRLASERAKNKTIRQACKTDEETVCKNEKNDTDMLMCIRRRDNDVSNRCRNTIEVVPVNIR